MRLTCICCYLLLVCASVSGQKGDAAGNIPVHAVKVSPLHLLNFYPTLELSYERRILSRFTLQAEGGYVLDYRRNGDDLFQDKRGIKVKLEGRYYFGDANGRRSLYYTAIEPYTNVINFDRYGAVEECFDVECNHPYTRRISFKMKYREKGVSAKVGIVWYWSQHFFGDFSAGLSFRDVLYEEPPLPDRIGYSDRRTFFDIPDEDDRAAIGPNMGLRIGYRFK